MFRTNLEGDVYFFVDWCPSEQVRFIQKDIDSPSISPIVINLKPSVKDFIIGRVLASKGVRIYDIACVARQDGLLLFSLCISNIESNDTNTILRPDFVTIARYVSKKLKEKMLGHSHVFHSSSISNAPGHFPVYLSKKSLSRTADKSDDFFNVENYTRKPQKEKLSFLNMIVSDDNKLARIKASHNNGIDSDRIALDVLCFHISNQACLAKHSIERLISLRKIPTKNLNRERKYAVIVASCIAFIINLVLYFGFGKIYIFEIALAFFIPLVMYIFQITQESKASLAIEGARYIATNSIGYAHSALYFSSIYHDILLSSSMSYEKVQAVKEINNAKINSSIEKLSILLTRIERRIKERTDKLIYYSTVCGVTVAVLGLIAK